MNRTWSSVLLMIVLVVAGCKGDKDKSGRRGSAKGGCQIKAATPADLVTSKTPQPIAPFAALKLGMSVADAKAACPNLWEDEDDAKKAGTFFVSGFVGAVGAGENERSKADDSVYATLDFTADKLSEIKLAVPGDLEPVLTAAWSKPTASPGPAIAHAWHDDATGIRAMLAPTEDGKRELTFSTYVPLKAFVELDTAESPIKFKPQHVLGKTPTELLKEFPDYVTPDQTSESTKKATEAMMADMKKEVEAMGVDLSKKTEGEDVDVSLPATPFGGADRTQAIFHLNDDGTVRNYAVWFRAKSQGFGANAASWPNEIADIVALFDKHWGPHKKIKRTLGEEATWYDAKAGIRASAEIDPAKPDELDVTYVRYQTMASFFGAPGPVWGFEKPDRPLLGATAAELVAAYGKAVEVAADGSTATIKLLPTDYDSDVSVTTILAFLRDGGKVDTWTVRFDYEAYDGARAEYEALLAAKFGPAPKPDKYGHIKFGKKPTVDAQYSDITHALNLEVSK
jgi:hypothetical protein